MAPAKRIGEAWIGALLLIGIMPLGLSGCSPVGMAVGAGATVTNMAMEERGFVTGEGQGDLDRYQRADAEQGSEAVPEHRRAGA
jgi:hypothetical protein